MGNKNNKNNNNKIQIEQTFFEDTIRQKNNNQNNKSSLEHNPLITQINLDPFLFYEKIKQIGSGSFATVYLVKNKKTGVIRAMKAIKKIQYDEFKNTIEESESNIINEINILMKMDHPNIVKIFEFYISSTHYHLVTEYCPGGSLFNFIQSNDGPFTEIQASYIMHQLFSVVNYCHKMKIIHRDIKPENILINNNDNGFVTIKVCDFGTSLRFNEGNDIQKKLVGSLYYIAPEVLKKNYNSKCDIWSCGVIMYILLTGDLPFGGKDYPSVTKKILNGSFNKTVLNKRCKACKDLIDKLLEKDIDKRIRADQALNHKWFSIFKSKEIKNDIEDSELIQKYIDNLKNFKINSTISEFALAYLVHNHPELKEVELACKIFSKIDTKGNGKITKDELYNGLSSFYQSENLKNDVDKIFKNFSNFKDISKNHKDNKYLEYEKFVRGSIDKKIFLTEESLKFAFNYLDKGGKGEINADDICNIFLEGNLGKYDIEKAKKIIKESTKNKTEIIKYEDFCEIMKAFLD